MYVQVVFYIYVVLFQHAFIASCYIETLENLMILDKFGHKPLQNLLVKIVYIYVQFVYIWFILL